MADKITARWTLKTQGGIESLQYEVKAELPELGEEDVLVEMHAASLNYRDLMIAKVYNPLIKLAFHCRNSTLPRSLYYIFRL